MSSFCFFGQKSPSSQKSWPSYRSAGSKSWLYPRKAFEPEILRISTDYQGLAEFKVLTLLVGCDEAIFDT
jgi:hypothetical protein